MPGATFTNLRQYPSIRRSSQYPSTDGSHQPSSSSTNPPSFAEETAIVRFDAGRQRSEFLETPPAATRRHISDSRAMDLTREERMQRLEELKRRGAALRAQYPGQSITYGGAGIIISSSGKRINQNNEGAKLISGGDIHIINDADEINIRSENSGMLAQGNIYSHMSATSVCNIHRSKSHIVAGGRYEENHSAPIMNTTKIDSFDIEGDSAHNRYDNTSSGSSESHEDEEERRPRRAQK